MKVSPKKTKGCSAKAKAKAKSKPSAKTQAVKSDLPHGASPPKVGQSPSWRPSPMAVKKYSFDRAKAAKKGLQELETMKGAKFFKMPSLEKFDQKWLIYD